MKKPLANKEELNLEDLMDEEEGEQEEELVIQQKSVPRAVFGSAMESDIEAATGRGAGDRLKKKN